MDNGWISSADAWIDHMGDGGDFGRRYVLDPVTQPRALAAAPERPIDRYLEDRGLWVEWRGIRTSMTTGRCAAT